MTHTRAVSRTVSINAPAQTIFDLLADPRMHPRIDGSGTVKGRIEGPQRLQLGAKFSMRMHMGLPYVIRSTVVEFEDNRRIAWRHPGRHIWRYELEPAADGGTTVTESFDYRSAPAAWVYEKAGVPARNARGIEGTLQRLKELAEQRQEIAS